MLYNLYTVGMQYNNDYYVVSRTYMYTALKWPADIVLHMHVLLTVCTKLHHMATGTCTAISLSERKYFLVSRVGYFVSFSQSSHCFSDVLWLKWTFLTASLPGLAPFLHYLTHVNLQKSFNLRTVHVNAASTWISKAMTEAGYRG